METNTLAVALLQKAIDSKMATVTRLQGEIETAETKLATLKAEHRSTNDEIETLVDAIVKLSGTDPWEGS